MRTIPAEAEIDDDVLVNFLVDSPDLIERGLETLIDRTKDRRRHAPTERIAMIPRYQAALALLRQRSDHPVNGGISDDDLAIDAVIDAFARLDSLNRDRAIERLAHLINR